jgi:transcriptional regulator with XRE-family HTH domain
VELALSEPSANIANRAYELGQAVRARGLELGKSQTELAKRSGMTQSVVSRLEAGGTVPTIGVLERLAAPSLSR